ncbi:cytochrome-c peroxidase [Chitinophaga nivalis]|uniref:Cytochrome-c peroxidase n=1 Tax=Chitinophaga nivalis TaxID=2991709 RepID=A0ABT3IRJ9_9BACT|nr:cytochrome c peroxidase [Chitinophaga nivalis]MCW3463717.1 cytochrome-c peroxidase [Chitinophaga nivalis]MCW3486593.1 cytochrome-c peroxidase [Chitinophaga nivalis]
MKHKAIYLVGIFGALLCLMHACKKERNNGDDYTPPEPFTLQLPPGFPTPEYNFAGNPLTRQGVELGRFMFYDYRLSKDSTVSCGFCHQQFAAFGHFDHALSHGVSGRQGTRSVPVLFNLIYQKAFMWDGGVFPLERQPFTPLTDPNEMGANLSELLPKMQADPRYRKMFKAAFGSEEITSDRMFKAITQFVATMISAGSRYDSVMRRLPGAQFTEEEQAGYATFLQKCAACHKEPLFTDLSYRSNGLPVVPFLNDMGRYRITLQGSDSLRFKVPSLRNILKSSPYMHDGRYFDIYQVFDFYDRGKKDPVYTDPLVARNIPLSDVEKRQLYLFFNTLTDYTLINNDALREVLIN